MSRRSSDIFEGIRAGLSERRITSISGEMTASISLAYNVPYPSSPLSVFFLELMSSIPTLSPKFQSIFDTALHDFAKQIGIDLATYPFAQAL